MRKVVSEDIKRLGLTPNPGSIKIEIRSKYPLPTTVYFNGPLWSIGLSMKSKETEGVHLMIAKKDKRIKSWKMV
jgi:hypothetical protein